MESITYNRADITFDGATYSNLWSIMKSGVAVETFVKGEGIKIRQTSSNTLYIYDEETRVYITYPNPALLPTDLSTINSWLGGSGSMGEIAESVLRGIQQTETAKQLISPAIVEIAPANASRKALKIFNRNGSPLVRFGQDNTLTLYHILPAGGTNGSWYEFPQPVPTGAIYARANSGTSNIIVTEG